MMNQVNIIGRMTADPELKENKQKYVRFGVAVQRNYAPKGEKPATDFINCVAFAKTAEAICKFFKKGSMIAINGELHSDTYEKDGKKTTSHTVSVNNFYFCESKNSGSTSAADPTPASTPAPAEEPAAPADADFGGDDFGGADFNFDDF